jgi:hypothetical protein
VQIDIARRQDGQQEIGAQALGKHLGHRELVVDDEHPRRQISGPAMFGPITHRPRQHSTRYDLGQGLPLSAADPQ